MRVFDCLNSLCLVLFVAVGATTVTSEARNQEHDVTCLALSHLELHQAGFGLTRAEDSLEHLRTKETPIGTRVSFRQHYRGVPVWDTRVHVFLDDAGEVRHVAGGTFPVESLKTEPTIPSRQVLARARMQADLPDATMATEPELIVRAREQGILAWLAIVYTGEDRVPVRLILDATEGTLLEQTTLMCSSGPPDPCDREWIIEGAEIETTVTTYPNTGDDPFNVFVTVANTWSGTPEWEKTQPVTIHGAGMTLLPGIEYEITILPTCLTWDTYNSAWGRHDVFFAAINSEAFYWDPSIGDPLVDRFCSGGLESADAFPGELWAFGGDVSGDDDLCVGNDPIVFSYQETDLSKTVYFSVGLQIGLGSPFATDLFPSWGSFRVLIQPKSVVFNPNPMTTMNDDTLVDDDDANDAAPLETYLKVDPLPLLTPPAANQPWKLEGEYCEIVDIISYWTGVPESADGHFGYLRDCDHFEAVNCYYHVTRSQQHIQSLGFVGALGIADYAIPVDPHGMSFEPQAAYVTEVLGSGTGYLKFGDGGGLVDFAEDADVILHEYGHAIQDHQTLGTYLADPGGDDGYGPETRAMGEGFADYWAASTFEEQNLASGFDPLLYGEWALPVAGQRRLDRNKLYPADMHATSEHNNGEIYSQPLWEIRSLIGRTTADRLILLSHWLLPVSEDPLFTDGALALLSADDLDNDNDAHDEIVAAFLARGIFRNAVVTAIDEDGFTLPTGVEITASEPDLNNVQIGNTPVDFVKPFKTTLTLTAGLLTDYIFDHWEVEGVDQGPNPILDRTLDDLVILPGGVQITAVYSFTGVGACWGADINSDGKVNGADLSILLGAWSTGSPLADLNTDGVVNGADLAILLGCWDP